MNFNKTRKSSLMSPNSRKKLLSRVRNKIFFIQKINKNLDHTNKKDSEIVKPNDQLIFAILKNRIRTNLELETLDNSFKKVKFFEELRKNLSQGLYRNLLQELNYQYKPKDQIVSNRGDYHSHVIIILSGSAFVLVPKKGIVNDIDSNSPSKKQSEFSNVVIQAMIQQKNRNNSITSSNKILRNRKPSIVVAENNKSESRNRKTSKSKELKLFEEKNNVNIKSEKIINGQKENNKEKNQKISGFSNAYNLIDMKRHSISIVQSTIPKFDPHISAFMKLKIHNLIEKEYEASEVDILNKFPEMKVEKVIREGDSYGEIAETIVAKENLHYAILSQKSYQRILGVYTGHKLKEKLNFLHSFSLFHDFTTARMSTLLFLFEYITLKRNEIVYKEGELSEYLYFVKSGEVEISKSVDFGEYYSDEGTKLVFNQVNDHRIHSAFTRRVKIMVAIKHLYFGQDEIINNEKRISRAIVISQECELYRIQKNKFFENIKNKNSLENLNSFTLLQQKYEKKLFHKIKNISFSSPMSDPEFLQNFKKNKSKKEKELITNFHNEKLNKDTIRKIMFKEKKIEINENDLKREEERLNELQTIMFYKQYNQTFSNGLYNGFNRKASKNNHNRPENLIKEKASIRVKSAMARFSFFKTY